MRIGAVLAAGLVTVAVTIALVLLDSKQRQAGTNYVPDAGEAVTLGGPNGTHCQAGQVVPGDAAAVTLLIGTGERPSPELRVEVRAGGATISTGRLPAGQAPGRVVIPIDPVGDVRPDAEVCIEARSSGKRRRTVVSGVPGQVRLEWLREGDESWLGLITTVAHRFGLGKPFVSGGWVLGLAALLLGVGWVLALRLTLRELDR